MAGGHKDDQLERSLFDIRQKRYVTEPGRGALREKVSDKKQTSQEDIFTIHDQTLHVQLLLREVHVFLWFWHPLCPIPMRL